MIRARSSLHSSSIGRRSHTSSTLTNRPDNAKELVNNDLVMVEAAGVEPAISIENTQLTDSVNARKEQNGMFAKSAYKQRTNFS